ncbi:hypothetical protein SDC9_108507 [bioreactor metagenome]|uniref:Uncharacterized protein n=1 Tax=bioreactor metagenome TaxID=1076179 RepID=A0A645B8C3_9ZZZZ
MHAGDKVSHAPVDGQEISEPKPKRRKGVVGAVELLKLIGLSAKCPYDPNTGQILLHRRHEHPFGLVGLHEALSCLGIEKNRIACDDRNED